MKEEVGVVDKYNGYTGKIKTDNKEFLLLDKEIVNNEKIIENDEVKFIPEKVNDINIARFVRKKQNL